jgi:hypothetical protein
LEAREVKVTVQASVPAPVIEGLVQERDANGLVPLP